MNPQKLDLDKREFGYWFAPFERELIWIKQQEHIGWVVPTSNKTFKLQSTPFSKHFKNYTYIAPTPDLMPPNNICVEIKPFKIIRDVRLADKNTYGEYYYYCVIDSFRKYDVEKNLPKPDITYNDFLYYCSENWVDAQEDYLDKIFALQLVSCPPALYGKGGIGTIASKISQNGNLVKSVVPQLNSTYNSIISTNFQKKNEKYYFNLIKNQLDLKSIEQERKRASYEINYCRPCLTFEDAKSTTNNIPIQLPLLITRAKYKNSDEMSEKYLLLQYQLTALMYNPNYDEKNSTFKKYRDNISEVIEMRELNPAFDIDSNAINKLALSFARLDFNNELKNKEIKDATDLLFSLWNDWDPYINEINSISKSRNSMQATDMSTNMTYDEQRFLVELRKLHDETNEKWIARELLEQKLDKKTKTNNFFDIAQNLCDLGFIIQKNNFSKFQRLNEL